MLQNNSYNSLCNSNNINNVYCLIFSVCEQSTEDLLAIAGHNVNLSNLDNKKVSWWKEVELGRKYKRKCRLLLSLSYKVGNEEILSNNDRTRYDSLLFKVIIQEEIIILKL